MSNKRVLYIVGIIVVINLACIFAAAFSYIGKPSGTDLNTNVSVNITSNNNAINFQYTGHTTMSLTVPAANVAIANASNTYNKYAVTSLRNTTINLKSNATLFPNGVTCTYDIVYTPTVAYRETPAATAAGLKELVLRGKIGSTYYFDTNIEGSDPVVVYSSSISTSSSSSTATTLWQFAIRFYNLNIDQSQAAGQTPSGVISIDNVNCASISLANYLINNAPKSGTSAVGSTPWILTSDRTGEWRYAGKNPDNYIEFNNELWRIIGVMPNMEYCTGRYGPEECDTTKTGSLVKIIKNSNLITTSWDYKQTGVGSSNNDGGSNDWSDSQLMLMLNGRNYLKTGYDINGAGLHSSYKYNFIAEDEYYVCDSGINDFFNTAYSYLDGNGTIVHYPTAIATTSGSFRTTNIQKITNKYLDKIATVRWDLYSTNNITADATGSPSAFYDEIHNNSNGVVYYVSTLSENRAAYWYGKVGLMYPSDYGYATYGDGSASGDYSRAGCLAKAMYNWSGDYATNCAYNSYLLYLGITSTAPGTTGSNIWTMSAYANYSYQTIRIASSGLLRNSNASTSYIVRPVLYLKSDTYIKSGTGKWNDPYKIS